MSFENFSRHPLRPGVPQYLVILGQNRRGSQYKSTPKKKKLLYGGVLWSSAQEIAEELGVRDRTVYKMINNGEIERVKA